MSNLFLLYLWNCESKSYGKYQGLHWLNKLFWASWVLCKRFFHHSFCSNRIMLDFMKPNFWVLFICMKIPKFVQINDILVKNILIFNKSKAIVPWSPIVLSNRRVINSTHIVVTVTSTSCNQRNDDNLRVGDDDDCGGSWIRRFFPHEQKHCWWEVLVDQMLI